MNDESQKLLSTTAYWEQQYSGDAGHEWLRSFLDLQPFLAQHLPLPSTDPRILHLGCGTSDVTQGLARAGYSSQCNVDFSPAAIASQRARHGADSTMRSVEWHVMDVRRMAFADGVFDAAFDKSTLDAMLWGSLWDPDEQVKTNVRAYVDEVARCLKHGGIWLCVSFRQPHFLRPLLAKEDVWDLEVQTLGGQEGTFEYFGWVIRKR